MPIDVGLAKIDSPRFQFDGYVTGVDLPVEDDRYPYLRLIDPYGETAFSSHQCAVIVSDFERLAAARPEADYQSVLALVRVCGSDPETRLWFLGD